MKIELEILPDQLELLQRIKSLPGLLSATIGLLPQSFPGSGCELERIKELCEDLEFKWKSWVMQGLITRMQADDLMGGIKVCKESEYLCREDL
jgi:hypothetical protein